MKLVVRNVLNDLSENGLSAVHGLGSLPNKFAEPVPNAARISNRLDRFLLLTH